MTGYARHWERVVGDGLVYNGPCILKVVVMYPDANNDYSDVYDGRDIVSGEKFARFEAETDGTVVATFGDGIWMGKGLYVDGKDDAVETTVGFNLPSEC